MAWTAGYKKGIMDPYGSKSIMSNFSDFFKESINFFESSWMMVILGSAWKLLRVRFWVKMLTALWDRSIPVTWEIWSEGSSLRTLRALRPEAVKASKNLKVFSDFFSNFFSKFFSENFFFSFFIKVLTTSRDMSRLKIWTLL